LENESSECFDELVTQHQERFAPADGVEFAMIEEMVAANWRMRRAWAIENRLMEKAIRNQPPGDEAARIAAAFSHLAASPELNLLHRYEARLHRIYQRALENLLVLGEPELPNEPSPISGHQPPEDESPPPQPPATNPLTAPSEMIGTIIAGGQEARPGRAACGGVFPAHAHRVSPDGDLHRRWEHPGRLQPERCLEPDPSGLPAGLGKLKRDLQNSHPAPPLSLQKQKVQKMF
jgi:hypothetical protein